MARQWGWLLVVVALFFAVAAGIRLTVRSERTRTAAGTMEAEAPTSTREGAKEGASGAAAEIQTQDPRSQRDPESQQETDEGTQEAGSADPVLRDPTEMDGPPADSTYYPGPDGSSIDPEGSGPADPPPLPHGTSRIYGTVLGKDNLPVRLVLVSVKREEDAAGLDVRPNDAGEYQAVNLAAATYVVVCAIQGEAVLSRRIALAEGEEKKVDFKVASGVRLFGWVSRGGRPVTATKVSFSPEQGADVTTTFAATDDQGNYEVRGVPPGAVMGRVGNHDYRVWIPEGVEELRYDIPLPEGILSGHVYEGRSRAPAKGARLDVYRVGDPKGDLAQHASRWVTSADAGHDGRYEAKGVGGGRYMIHVTHPDFGTRVHGPIEVPERGAAEGIDLYLGDPGQILGTVLDATGVPIQDAEITLRDANTGEPFRPSKGRITTSRKGRFVVTGIPSGLYRVTAHASGHAQSSRRVMLADGLEQMDFRLGEEAVVVVLVKDVVGKTVEHGVLVIWDALGDPVDALPGGWNDPESSQSNEEGILIRGGLATGTYRGEVASALGRGVFEFSVTEGKMTKVDVTVTPVPEEER